MSLVPSYALYASVILDSSIDKLLDYGVLPEQENSAKEGVKVEVTVKGKKRAGYIYALKKTADFPNVLPIAHIHSDQAILTFDLLQLATWMSKYYCTSLSDILHIMLPAVIRKDTQHKEQLYVMRGKTKEYLIEYCEKIRNKHPAQAEVLDVLLKVKKGILLTELLELAKVTKSPVTTLSKQGLLHIEKMRIDRSPLINEEYFKTKAKPLYLQQAVALESIKESLSKSEFKTHLLFGVTGSGKTEVYLQAIDFALQQNKGTIMLVPEISLTAQTIERFRSRFEGKIAILHHRLSEGERFDEWHKIRRGEANIVIGARSAVFSPVKNLGLIIVDEEHEPSYKQSESAPCYHARDVSVMRGKLLNCTVILGSATPSLESYYNARSGKYALSLLNQRADAASLPKFTLVDMKKEYEKAKGYTTFSDPLLKGIKERQQKGEQTILFLNRRGYNTTLLCSGCGQSVKCSHCDIALTFHYSENCLTCHLCGYNVSPPPHECPLCQSPHMKYRGVGTEQVERSLHAVLPEIRTLRIDADTTRHKGSHQKLLRDFGTGKADVLIGTQMIAKGLHFPEVTLVGVLNTDASLNIPDFRASENIFQLVTQVAGRAGRGYSPGEVILQTCLTDNRTIVLAASQSYEKFYDEEVKIRELFSYPPFSNLVKLTFSGEDIALTLKSAEEVRDILLRKLPSTFEIHPVIPSGYAKIKNKHRFQILIKGPSIYPVSHVLTQYKLERVLSHKVNLLIDVNPTSTFF